MSVLQEQRCRFLRKQWRTIIGGVCGQKRRMSRAFREGIPWLAPSASRASRIFEFQSVYRTVPYLKKSRVASRKMNKVEKEGKNVCQPAQRNASMVPRNGYSETLNLCLLVNVRQLPLTSCSRRRRCRKSRLFFTIIYNSRVVTLKLEDGIFVFGHVRYASFEQFVFYVFYITQRPFLTTPVKYMLAL